MAATTAQKKAVFQLLTEKKAYVDLLSTAIDALMTDLTESSTAAQLDAAVDLYDTARNAAYTTYGGVQLPALDASTALAAVDAEANA